MLARGHECDGHGLAFDSGVYDRRRLHVFLEQVVPGLEDLGVDKEDLALEVSRFLEIGRSSVPDIDDRNVTNVAQGGRPCNRNSTHMELRHGESALLEIFAG